jgi:hypothetical protein
MAPVLSQPLRDMSTRYLPGVGGGKGRPACTADSLSAICKPTALDNVGSSTTQNPVGLHSLLQNKKNKLHGLSSRANYTDRATAACRRSDCQLLRIEVATWSA